jgi:membrane-associated protein
LSGTHAGGKINMFIANILLHLDKYLNMIVQSFGLETYLILFLILFCETGLVITPFLPGDSLIFTAGMISALGSLNIILLFLVIVLAVIAGDFVNYALGKSFGLRLLSKDNQKDIRKEHIMKTQGFYDKYGGITILVARFIPIIRTIAPFLAGIGRMEYPKFISYNVIGGVAWTSLFLFGGYYFGTLLVVKNNFSVVLYGIIFISVIPVVIGFVQQKIKKCSC